MMILATIPNTGTRMVKRFLYEMGVDWEYSQIHLYNRDKLQKLLDEGGHQWVMTVRDPRMPFIWWMKKGEPAEKFYDMIDFHMDIVDNYGAAVVNLHTADQEGTLQRVLDYLDLPGDVKKWEWRHVAAMNRRDGSKVPKGEQDWLDFKKGLNPRELEEFAERTRKYREKYNLTHYVI